MKVGVFITAMVGGMRDGALRWNDLQMMAVRAESIGMDSFWVPDHLIFKKPGEPVHGPWECWSLLAALGVATNRIEIGSLVSCFSFRNPGLVAKTADTVDEISGGRLILGLGAGWHEPEYEAFGFPFDHRFARFEEALTVIGTLLREGQIDHQGEYYTLRECELRPRGPRQQGPPLLIGALATRPRMLRLAAEYADLWNGWLVQANSSAEEIPALRSAVDLACEKAGRAPGQLGRTVGICVDQRPARDRTAYPEGMKPLSGSPEEIAQELKAFASQGIEHIQITPLVPGVAGVEALAPVLELLDADGG